MTSETGAGASTGRVADGAPRLLSREFLGFAFRSQRSFFLVAAVVVATCVTAKFAFPGRGLDKFLDAIGTIAANATVVIALAVWYGERREAWLASLPKKLTVTVTFDSKIVATSVRAPLVHEGDLRAWSQQLAAQMAGERTLSFEPRLEMSGPVLTTPAGGTSYQQYEVNLTLTKLPAAFAACLARGAPLPYAHHADGAVVRAAVAASQGPSSD